MILIYTPDITPRISYITRYIFSDILKVSCNLTTNTDEFQNFNGPRINYSSTDLGGIKIPLDSFILEKGISYIEIPLLWNNGIPLLFPQNSKADLPFDLFSAAFYLVSRYEEYVNNERDEHGRFQAISSLAFKKGFLEIPVVDIWAGMIKSLIATKYPGYNFPEKQFQFIPTIDVDVAYAYKGKGFKRTIASTAKNIFNIPDQKLRWNTLILNKPDPFDTYDLYKQWHNKFNLSPIFFIHVGKYGAFDKCVSPKHPLMQSLIKKLSEEFDIGIHPSYRSNSQPPVIESEMEILSSIAGKPIYRSRQHFLKFNIAQTYPILAACGITEEYSMGYAELPGFRAGTCTPFNFYDLNKEEETTLKIYPFTFMDGNWINYLHIKPDSALDRIENLIRIVKNVNGTLITIWHNQSISEIANLKGWRNVYPTMLEIANMLT